MTSKKRVVGHITFGMLFELNKKKNTTPEAHQKAISGYSVNYYL